MANYVDDRNALTKYVVTDITQKTYEIGFPVTNDESFEVFIDNTLLELDLDYSVTGNLIDGSGSIVINTALLTNNILTMVGDSDNKRVTDFEQQARFSSKLLDQEFDNAFRSMRDVYTQTQFSIKLYPSDYGVFNTELPAISPNKVLMVNADATGFLMSDLIQDTGVGAYVQRAETAATNAELSETNALNYMNQAKTSETNAKESETNAEYYQGQAEVSAAGAVYSEQMAFHAVMDAAGHAADATTQATAASNSATQANTSEVNAKASEDTAQAQATIAVTSASNAKVSETNSKSSELSAEHWAEVAQSAAGEIYVNGGVFTPRLGNEYPSTTGVTKDTLFIVDLPRDNSFTFTTGSLAGKITASGDSLLYSITRTEWNLVESGSIGSISQAQGDMRYLRIGVADAQDVGAVSNQGDTITGKISYKFNQVSSYPATSVYEEYFVPNQNNTYSLRGIQTGLAKYNFGIGLGANLNLWVNQDGNTDTSRDLMERGKRVYSPNNKPTAADLGVLDEAAIKQLIVDSFGEFYQVGDTYITTRSGNPNQHGYIGTWVLQEADAGLNTTQSNAGVITGSNTQTVPVQAHGHGASFSGDELAPVSYAFESSTTFSAGTAYTSIPKNLVGSASGVKTTVAGLTTKAKSAGTPSGSVDIAMTGTSNATMNVQGKVLNVFVWIRTQ